jgi:hypothetical protein
MPALFYFGFLDFINFNLFNLEFNSKEKMNNILKWILIALVILLIMAFVLWKFVPMKTPAEKCYDNFNERFIQQNSTLLYPDYVRDCCAKPVSEQAYCLNQYGFLD